MENLSEMEKILGADTSEAIEEIISLSLNSDNKSKLFALLANLIEVLKDDICQERKPQLPEKSPSKEERVKYLINWLRERS